MDLVELSTRKKTILLLCFNTINVTYDGFNNYHYRTVIFSELK